MEHILYPTLLFLSTIFHCNLTYIYYMRFSRCSIVYESRICDKSASEQLRITHWSGLYWFPKRLHTRNKITRTPRDQLDLYISIVWYCIFVAQAMCHLLARMWWSNSSYRDLIQFISPSIQLAPISWNLLGSASIFDEARQVTFLLGFIKITF